MSFIHSHAEVCFLLSKKWVGSQCKAFVLLHSPLKQGTVVGSVEHFPTCPVLCVLFKGTVKKEKDGPIEGKLAAFCTWLEDMWWRWHWVVCDLAPPLAPQYV